MENNKIYGNMISLRGKRHVINISTLEGSFFRAPLCIKAWFLRYQRFIGPHFAVKYDRGFRYSTTG